MNPNRRIYLSTICGLPYSASSPFPLCLSKKYSFLTSPSCDQKSCTQSTRCILISSPTRVQVILPSSVFNLGDLIRSRNVEQRHGRSNEHVR